MNFLSDDMLRVAFDLQQGEALSEEQQAICLEWMTGKAKEYIKISIDDPRLFELAAFYDVLEKRKTSRWKQIK